MNDKRTMNKYSNHITRASIILMAKKNKLFTPNKIGSNYRIYSYIFYNFIATITKTFNCIELPSTFILSLCSHWTFKGLGIGSIYQ